MTLLHLQRPSRTIGPRVHTSIFVWDSHRGISHLQQPIDPGVASLCAASSSYLLGDQLTGVSTADAYRRQLLQVLDVSALHAKQPPHFCDPWSHSNAVIWRWTAGTA